jgi:hypothetical protein
MVTNDTLPNVRPHGVETDVEGRSTSYLEIIRFLAV